MVWYGMVWYGMVGYDELTSSPLLYSFVRSFFSSRTRFLLARCAPFSSLRAPRTRCREVAAP